MAGITRRTIDIITKILGIRQERSPIEEERFSFVVSGVPEEAFHVVRFRTEGGLNRCYRIDIDLVSKEPDISCKNMIMSGVFAVMKSGNDSFIPYRGFLSEFEELRKVDDYVFYRAVLVPKLWLLTRTESNQIFLNKTIEEILTDVLIDGGLTNIDFEFRLRGSHDKRWEYVCQYGESHYNFFVRRLEQEGLYFFFEMTDDGDKVIITDTRFGHTKPYGSRPLEYHPPSGLDSGTRDNMLSEFRCLYRSVPKSVTVKDYNYRHASAGITGQADIADGGTGNLYVYGDHFQTEEEAAQKAGIRAEEIRSRQVTFHGRSNGPFIRPGFIIDVEDHYLKDYNGSYLVTHVEHEGNQTGYLTSGLQKILTEREQSPVYANSFTAIPASVQYRPPCVTVKPRFHGVMNGVIDSGGSGKYAELDGEGRYKVILPFDMSGRTGGKASSWIRMAQPYTGGDHGMHFPLHKGTEVLLAFIDGDPDRPIITGAVPNSMNRSVIKDDSATRAGFVTPGKSGLLMDDREGKERMVLQSGSGSMLYLGGTGQGNETGSSSTSNWAYASAASISFANVLAATASMFGITQMTGYLKVQSWATLVHAAIMQLPNWEEIFAGGDSKKTSSGSDGDEKVDIGGIARTFLPVFLIIWNVVFSILKTNIVKRRLKAARIEGFEEPDVGFAIIREEEGAALQMSRTGIDMAIVADGSIDINARKNLFLVSDQSLYAFTGSDVNLEAHKGINMTSETGSVQLYANQGHILIGNQDPAFRGKTKISSYRTVVLQCGGAELALDGEQKGTEKVTVKCPGGITLQVGEVSVHISNNKVEVKAPDEIAIKAKKVKINDLLVDEEKMIFRDQTINLGGVLKIK